MKKSNFKKSMKSINNITKRIPKSINEAINFNEYDDNDFEEDYDEGYDEPAIEQPTDINKGDDLNVNEFINDTRKKALNIMAKLADEPESKIYETAKRIWQICDKSISDEKAETEGGEQQKPTR